MLEYPLTVINSQLEPVSRISRLNMPAALQVFHRQDACQRISVLLLCDTTY